MPAPFIYINSWPGVGKHTISKELEKLFDGKVRLVSTSSTSRQRFLSSSSL
jgi:tRNA uridine 5-carbamoylmethylation protein Kti12